MKKPEACRRLDSKAARLSQKPWQLYTFNKPQKREKTWTPKSCGKIQLKKII
jgi:hypothetical protein